MTDVLRIGYLPILDHLTLGVALAQDAEATAHVQAVQFLNWEAIESAWDRGELDGAFLLAPFVIDRFRRSNDVRLLLLGHREGQTLLAKPEIHEVADLTGHSIRLPDPLSTHAVLARQLFSAGGLAQADVVFHFGCPDLRKIADNLSEGSDAACLIAEPMATEARRQGIAAPLALSHDIAAHHIDCVLVLKRSVVTDDPTQCQALVTSLVRAGAFTNAYPRQAAEIGSKFLGWPAKLLLEALTHDEGHIIFWDLLPRVEDVALLRDAAVATGVLPAADDRINELVDSTFAREAYRDWVIDLRQEVRDRGAARTIPGSTAEAIGRLRALLPDLLETVNVFQVPPGRAFPAQSTPIARLEHLEEVIGTGFVRFEDATGRFKAIALTAADTNESPQRVILQLSPVAAYRVFVALGCGAPIDIPSVNTSMALTATPQPVAQFADREVVWLSLAADVARFLPALLAQFSPKDSA